MKVGISLPQLGLQVSRENLIRMSTRAEQLGYDSAWVLERLLWPVSPQEPYPVSPDGSLPETYQNVLDPIETLTFVSAHTTRLRVGTSVLVLPFHTPIQLARRIATLDVLSGGRAEVGVGVGWSRDEFEAAGTPFARRGARSDEFLRVMIDIWTNDPVAFQGEFYKIPESKVGPKPVQKPHPPIYIGGSGENTLKRAARFGSGWNPAGPSSFEDLEAGIKSLNEIARAEGRGPMEVVLRLFTVVFDQPAPAQRGPGRGSLAEIREDLQRLREMGVTHIIHSPPEIGFSASASIDLALTRMEQLIEISR